jgi:hypothetical protein
MMVAIQIKEGLYRNQYLAKKKFPLAIEVFGCLHQQVDNFLHHCANMAWVANVSKGPLLLILGAFYR